METAKMLQQIISTHSLTRRLTDNEAMLRERLSISTHSLTRRLTLVCVYTDKEYAISTHSLTRRLTLMLLQNLVKERLFQLTASQGG